MKRNAQLGESIQTNAAHSCDVDFVMNIIIVYPSDLCS